MSQRPPAPNIVAMTLVSGHHLVCPACRRWNGAIPGGHVDSRGACVLDNGSDQLVALSKKDMRDTHPDLSKQDRGRRSFWRCLAPHTEVMPRGFEEGCTPLRRSPCRQGRYSVDKRHLVVDMLASLFKQPLKLLNTPNRFFFSRSNSLYAARIRLLLLPLLAVTTL